MRSHSSGCPGRRAFLLSAGAGLAGAGLTWAGLRGYPAFRRRFLAPSFTGQSVEDPKPIYGMPGPFPGRVVEVHRPDAVNDRNQINADAVKAMMARGMCELTGADHATEAWRKFFNAGDVVGIKVNPVGCFRGYNPRAVPAISSPAVLLETVAGLKEAGRPSPEHHRFRALRHRVPRCRLRPGVARTVDGRRALVRLGLARRRRPGRCSRLRSSRPTSAIRTSSAMTPIISFTWAFAIPATTIPPTNAASSRTCRSSSPRWSTSSSPSPCLKDHKSAGVTLALKNLSHGLNNNVARSHLGGIYRGVVTSGRVTGPNQCNTFIPTAVNQPLFCARKRPCTSSTA